MTNVDILLLLTQVTIETIISVCEAISQALCTVQIKLPTKDVFQLKQNGSAKDDNINIKSS